MKKSTPSPKRKSEVVTYKVVVTWVSSEHSTEKDARAALKKLKPQKSALGVVIKTSSTTAERT